MTSFSEHDARTTAGTALSGLTPTQSSAFARDAEAQPSGRDTGKFSRTMFATMPIILVGSMAVSMNLTGPIEHLESKAPTGDKTEKAQRPTATVEDQGVPVAADLPDGEIATAAAPSTYRVASGDTVSSVAGRYGLSTASVLALNGLGWKSTIFPGQVLKLVSGAVAAAPVAAPAAATPPSTGSYTIVKGDTIGRIASRFGVSTQAVLSANGLSTSSIIYPGQKLAIPGASSAAPAAAPVASKPVASKPAAPAAGSGSYTIVSGDTLSKIAAKVGVSVQALLAANKLTLSSVIYAGRTLVVPSASAAPSAPTATNGSITLLTGEMTANARTIIQVGKGLGVSNYGIVIALSAAMQESSLRNINYGHLDSVGLFQQRPSSGWGTVAQLTDPAHAARLFYGGPSNPNRGVTSGLLDVPGWSSLTVTQAAQRVQISAFPDAYAKWENSARFWLSELT
jgi:LysM repeat protein